MVRKHWRFPIFWKFLLSSLVLTGALIGGSYAYTKYLEGKVEPRGQFLQKHLDRYIQYQRGLGGAVQAIAEVLADHEGLRTALETDQREQARVIAARLYDGLASSSGLKPDVFLVFDADGRPIFISDKSPIQADDLTALQPISRVRTGGDHYHDELLVHGGRVMQLTGQPIKGAGGKGTLGGIVIGIYIEHYYEEFMVQSDKKPERRYRSTLLSKDGVVLASMFPPEQWPDLAAALQGKREFVPDGKDQLPLVKFDKVQWDFAQADISGFVGSDTKDIGTMYVMRQRTPRKEESMVVPVALGIVFSLLAAMVMALWMTRSLKQLIRATREIAEGAGDLTKRIESSSNDEIADLADNLNRVFDNLHRLAHDVQSASLQVGTSSAEISAASKQMLEGAKDQAVKIESSTAAVTELSSSIQTVAANAISATKVAKESNEAVGSAMDSMSRIRSTVEEAADKIQELGESGKRIGNIVEVIRQISEQTSLLALNASIEAAHAGEQGRGFAVVADEVSSLARRVGQSAKDIEDLIQTIKEQTADAVRAMQAGTKEVESGTGMVTGTLTNLKQIIDMVQDTAGAVQEQAIVSDEIARNMDAVQKIANEVVASSEEAVIQGEQLHSLAHHLEESVRGFNLDGEGQPAPAMPAPPPRKTLPAAGKRKTGVRSVVKPPDGSSA